MLPEFDDCFGSPAAQYLDAVDAYDEVLLVHHVMSGKERERRFESDHHAKDQDGLVPFTVRGPLGQLHAEAMSHPPDGPGGEPCVFDLPSHGGEHLGARGSRTDGRTVRSPASVARTSAP